jgi:hypothetical protein
MGTLKKLPKYFLNFSKPRISNSFTPSITTNTLRLTPPLSSIGSLDGQYRQPDAGFVAIGRFFAVGYGRADADSDGILSTFKRVN